jgi:maltoporin
MEARSGQVLIVLVVFVGVTSAVRAADPTNSEVQAIQMELKQLEEDYQRRMQALEQRLKQIENASTNGVPATNTSSAATNAASETAARARAFLSQEFRQDSETRDYAMARQENQALKQRVEQVLANFIDIGGYVRAGYGRDNQGGPQVAFQAPGAFAKYRLGNEAENYAELVFGKDWYAAGQFSLDSQARPDAAPSGPVARTQIRLAFYDPYSSELTVSGFQISMPEAWAALGNLFPAQPLLKFWAGSRFYRRQDIYIDDFYFYNMSGAGGGFEDLELPFGKIALAWIGNGAQSGIYSSDIAALPDPNNQAGFSKQSWDLSLYDVRVPWGRAEFALVYARETSGLDADGLEGPNSQGVAFTFVHTHDHFLSEDGFNKLSLQIGNAAAKTFTSGYQTETFTNGTYIIPDEPGSWRFRVTESFVAQLTKHFAISPALVYQYTAYNNFQGNVQWFSAGARPVYFFNKFFSIAFEGGVDYVDDSSLPRAGTLYKLSLAPQVSLGDHFFSRPVLRMFVTYAGWSNSFKGAVGGNDYANETQGLTCGVQMESWW